MSFQKVSISLTCRELRICLSMASTHLSLSSALGASKIHCLLPKLTM